MLYRVKSQFLENGRSFSSNFQIPGKIVGTLLEEMKEMAEHSLWKAKSGTAERGHHCTGGSYVPGFGTAHRVFRGQILCRLYTSPAGGAINLCPHACTRAKR